LHVKQLHSDSDSDIWTLSFSYERDLDYILI